ncbi:MAG: hypothetical protein WC246_01615 [Candidatus Paceibacterota bacterium]
MPFERPKSEIDPLEIETALQPTEIGHGEVPYVQFERIKREKTDTISIETYVNNQEHRRNITLFANLFAHEIALTAHDSAETGDNHVRTSDEVLIQYRLLRGSFKNWLDNASGFDDEERAIATEKFQTMVASEWSHALNADGVLPDQIGWGEARALWKALNEPEVYAAPEEEPAD